MRYKNNFVIHTTEQLIDINKSLPNFEANISITTQNEDDNFEIVIVTQKQLDDSDFQLNYKKIEHYVTVNVKSNKNETRVGVFPRCFFGFIFVLIHVELNFRRVVF